jgi:hypothetical protein
MQRSELKMGSKGHIGRYSGQGVHWVVMPGAWQPGTGEGGDASGPCTPQGGAEDPSPIETTFSGKRGVPAQPLLASSAAPQLAGEPALEEGPAPPHVLALPLRLLSSDRAPPPPSPPPLSFPHPDCAPLPLRLAGRRLGRPRPEREAGALAAAATPGCGGERDPRPRGGPASGPGTRGLPLHPQPWAAVFGLAAGWRR